MRQYASTVHALYDAEVCVDKVQVTPTSGATGGTFNDRFAGKASGWLNKGQQAVKGLEKKRVDGFVLSPSVSRCFISA